MGRQGLGSDGEWYCRRGSCRRTQTQRRRAPGGPEIYFVSLKLLKLIDR